MLRTGWPVRAVFLLQDAPASIAFGYLFPAGRSPCKHSIWGPISCRTQSVQAWGLDIPSLQDEVLASMGFGDNVHASIANVMTPKRRLSGCP